jgi:arsenate reductase-like glutaredoxin family protein
LWFFYSGIFSENNMIQIFGTQKCRNTQKALRFFRERRVEIQFRNMTIKPPSAGELDDMAAALGGYEAMLDADAAKERGLSYMDYDAREELLNDYRLYKTPLIRAGKDRPAGSPKAVLGFDEKKLREMLGG